MNKWWCVLMVLLITACSDLKKVPSEFLQPKKMQSVLWDMMLADRYVDQHLKQDTTVNAEEERFRLYAQVFSINEINYQDFKKSMHYYLSRPDQLKRIYEDIRNERDEILKLELLKATETEELQLKEQDSLLKISREIDSLKKLSDSVNNKPDSVSINVADSLKKSPFIDPLLKNNDSSLKKFRKDSNFRRSDRPGSNTSTGRKVDILGRNASQ